MSIIGEKEVLLPLACVLKLFKILAEYNWNAKALLSSCSLFDNGLVFLIMEKHEISCTPNYGER